MGVLCVCVCVCVFVSLCVYVWLLFACWLTYVGADVFDEARYYCVEVERLSHVSDESLHLLRLEQKDLLHKTMLADHGSLTVSHSSCSLFSMCRASEVPKPTCPSLCNTALLHLCFIHVLAVRQTRFVACAKLTVEQEINTILQVTLKSFKVSHCTPACLLKGSIQRCIENKKSTVCSPFIMRSEEAILKSINLWREDQ